MADVNEVFVGTLRSPNFQKRRLLVRKGSDNHPKYSLFARGDLFDLFNGGGRPAIAAFAIALGKPTEQGLRDRRTLAIRPSCIVEDRIGVPVKNRPQAAELAILIRIESYRRGCVRPGRCGQARLNCLLPQKKKSVLHEREIIGIISRS